MKYIFESAILFLHIDSFTFVIQMTMDEQEWIVFLGRNQSFSYFNKTSKFLFTFSSKP